MAANSDLMVHGSATLIASENTATELMPATIIRALLQLSSAGRLAAKTGIR